MHTPEESQLILSFLGSLYLCKPTRQVLENWKELASEPSPPHLKELLDALYQIDPTNEIEVDELVWEYTRLFIGPYKVPAPPWESVYSSPKRLMMQEAHDLVQECYQEAGFRVEQEGLMADHIGLELTFLAMLNNRIIEGPDQKEQLKNSSNLFTKNHLLNWVPEFTDDFENAAESPLYLALARATRNFVISYK